MDLMVNDGMVNGFEMFTSLTGLTLTVTGLTDAMALIQAKEGSHLCAYGLDGCPQIPWTTNAMGSWSQSWTRCFAIFSDTRI